MKTYRSAGLVVSRTFVVVRMAELGIFIESITFSTAHIHKQKLQSDVVT